ncbi:hypothetical protein X797_004319 [Metarhizium robertsii]|uniref:Uncharacterized protein n=1 Tax=Metarhizium robertsii TaxID=568076 RepID=A0A0A1UX63_9HYPO|nr:hypothetical protein X797_004319 [Metarhizium robertsii]
MAEARLEKPGKGPKVKQREPEQRRSNVRAKGLDQRIRQCFPIVTMVIGMYQQIYQAFRAGHLPSGRGAAMLLLATHLGAWTK